MGIVTHFDMLLSDDDLAKMREDEKFRMHQWFMDDRDGKYYEVTVRAGDPPDFAKDDPRDNFMVKVP